MGTWEKWGPRVGEMEIGTDGGDRKYGRWDGGRWKLMRKAGVGWGVRDRD